MMVLVRVYLDSRITESDGYRVIGGKYYLYGLPISFKDGRFSIDVLGGDAPEALARHAVYYSIRAQNFALPDRDRRIKEKKHPRYAMSTATAIVDEATSLINVDGKELHDVLRLHQDILDGKAVPIGVDKSFGEVMAELEDTKQELELARTEIKNREEARGKTLDTLNIIQSHYDGAKAAADNFKKVWALPWYLRLAWAVGLYRPL
jgi:hypothetical protein